MAITTVTTWCDNPGDIMAEGLTIGGIQITYAELLEIHDRDTALDMGVTTDLLEMWEFQGGSDYGQLVDWLYSCAAETGQEPRGAKPVTRKPAYGKDWVLSRIGPIILVQTTSEEFYASMQIAYNQANRASCVFTRWEIDGETSCQQLAGNNQDWPKFWAAFLTFLPPDLAAEIRRDEDAVRY
jgi:hypothetical protein